MTISIRRPSRLSAFCCLLILVFGFFGNRSAAGRQATPIDVKYDLRRETITLGEPDTLSLELRNNFSKSITLVRSPEEGEFFDLSLLGPDNKTSINKFDSSPGREGGLLISEVDQFGAPRIELPPGGHYHTTFVLSRWFDLSIPGIYVLTVRISNPIESADIKPFRVPSQQFRIEVKPRDAVQLEKVSSKLAQEIETAPNADAARDAVFELGSIRDPVAVPYLVRMMYAHKLGEQGAITALEGIGNDQAVEALISALKENYDDIARLSKQALSRLRGRISNSVTRAKIDRALAIVNR